MDIKDLRHCPRMIVSVLLQLVFYTLTEPEMFLLAVAAVLFGFLLGPLWAVAIYVSVYLVWRMTGTYVTMIASKIHLVASVMGKRQES
jgi:hypothetical protein